MLFYKQIIVSIIGLVIILVISETTNIDIFVQSYFYDFSNESWLLNPKENKNIHFIFYDGIKVALVFTEIITLFLLIFYKNTNWIEKNFRALLIVAISLIAVPTSVSLIKSVSNVSCPKALNIYDGEIPYIPIFKPYPNGLKPNKSQRCFPAAHASAGFALLSLFFLGQSKRRRLQFVAFSLGIGWLMGGYKMLIGDHFLSHTAVSMIFAWLLINVIALTVNLKTNNA